MSVSEVESWAGWTLLPQLHPLCKTVGKVPAWDFCLPEKGCPTDALQQRKEGGI